MRILIVKTSSLGDIIHAFPVITYLKEKLPIAKVDWVVEQSYSSLVKSHPQVDHVISINSKDWRKTLFQKSTRKEIKHFVNELQQAQYDVVIDLQGNTKSGLITYLAKSRHKVGFARTVVPEILNILATNHRYCPPKGKNIRDDYLFLVQSFFDDFQEPDSCEIMLNVHLEEEQKIEELLSNQSLLGKKKILVSPGSAWNNKQLSEEAIEEFLSQLYEEVQPVFLFAWGSEQELKISKKLHSRFSDNSLLMDKLSLPALQKLMSRVDLVFAMDSLPLHLAGTTLTSTYSVFGPSSAKKYCPTGKRHQSFQGYCPYRRTFEKRCPVLRTCETGNCMKQISGVSIYEHFSQSFPFLY